MTDRESKGKRKTKRWVSRRELDIDSRKMQKRSSLMKRGYKSGRRRKEKGRDKAC